MNDKPNNSQTVDVGEILKDLYDAQSRLKEAAVYHNGVSLEVKEAQKNNKSEWVAFRNHVRTQLKQAVAGLMVDLKNLLQFCIDELKDFKLDMKKRQADSQKELAAHKKEAERALRVANNINKLIK